MTRAQASGRDQCWCVISINWLSCLSADQFYFCIFIIYIINKYSFNIIFSLISCILFIFLNKYFFLHSNHKCFKKSKYLSTGNPTERGWLLEENITTYTKLFLPVGTKTPYKYQVYVDITKIYNINCFYLKVCTIM